LAATFHAPHRVVDYIILLQGEVTALLDIGEVRMKPFDVLIQRGTNHGWVNYGESPPFSPPCLSMLSPCPDVRSGQPDLKAWNQAKARRNAAGEGREGAEQPFAITAFCGVDSAEW